MPQSQQTNSIHELKKLLAQIPEGSVWHDILDADGTCLHRGTGDPQDGICRIMHKLDFKNKTILDLGCNTGHNTFLALENGASHVLGVDLDPAMLKCAKLLADIRGEQDKTDFIECSLTDVEKVSEQAAQQGGIDMILLVDFIGKNFLSGGRLKGLLAALHCYDCAEIAMTVRPLYRVGKHFRMDDDEFLKIHPNSHTRDGQYHLAQDIADSFAADWVMTPAASELKYEVGTGKILLHFHRL